MDTSPTDSQERDGIESRSDYDTYGQHRNNIESQSHYEVSDNKYDYPHQEKLRRAGQGIDRTFDVIVGALQSATVQVS